jgi:YbbR domain-containing protein
MDSVVKKITGIVFDNLLIKLFSVVFAVTLWLHVSARGTSEVNLVVPLELREIPRNMMVVGNVPGFVSVRLQGQEGIVRRLSSKDLTAFISLSGATPGQENFSITQSNITVPSNIRVTSVKPSEVSLTVEKVVTRTLPVRADLVGSPVPGYIVSRVEITPAAVTVAGPESSIRNLRSVFTQNLDLDGAAGSFETISKLDAPGAPGLKLEEEDVRVVITLSKTK